jgi:hypothetical protein
MEERVSSIRFKDEASIDELGFFDIDENYSLLKGRLQFEPSLPESGEIGDYARGHILLGGNRIKQFYIDTEIFGDLIVDQVINVTSRLEQTNIDVLDRAAVLRYVKYSDGDWATVLHAPVGEGKLIMIESSKYLAGEDLDDFVSMAERIAKYFNR